MNDPFAVPDPYLIRSYSPGHANVYRRGTSETVGSVERRKDADIWVPFCHGCRRHLSNARTRTEAAYQLWHHQCPPR